MAADEAFTISNLHVDELDITTGMAAREGWNVGPHDPIGFYAADSEGFYAGRLGERLVACIYGVNYGNEFGVLGRYIVEPDCRGRGYGIQLWERAMNHLGDRPLGLNAALVMEGKYATLGFVAAHKGARFAAVSHAFSPCVEGVVPLDKIPFDAVRDFDRRFFPASRDSFLKAWLKLPESHGFAAVDSRGNLSAYGMIRRFNTGWKIGPLFADAPDAADLLYEVLQGSVPENEPVFIDLAMNNPDAMTLVTRRGMEKVFENMRMYKGKTPHFNLMGVYSFTSQELG
jgi:GNAT superfamily N-acetyltransferase